MKKKGIIIVVSIIAALIVVGAIALTVKQVKSSNDDSTESTGITYYVVGDHIPVFANEDENSTIVTYLNNGDAVMVLSFGTMFSYICTADGQYGYILNSNISQDYPIVATTTTTETTVETSETTLYPDDVFGLIVNGQYINLDSSYDEASDAFGEPFSSNGESFYFSESWMTEIETDGEDGVESINTYAESVSIPEGIELGDTRDEVLSTLGTPYCVRGTEFILENGDMVHYSLDDYLHGDVVGGKTYGDPCDYIFYYVKGDTVLGIQWQIPESVDPNAVVIGFSLNSKAEFDSYNMENDEDSFFP